MEESIMVLEESRPLLASLATLAPQLNESTDRFMAEVKTVEEELQRLNLGVDVECDVYFEHSMPLQDTPVEGADEAEHAQRYFFAWHLAFGRAHDKWRMLVKHYRVDGGFENPQAWTLLDTTPLREASRDLRIAAAEHIPDLLKEIEKRVKEKIAALNKVAAH